MKKNIFLFTIPFIFGRELKKSSFLEKSFWLSREIGLVQLVIFSGLPSWLLAKKHKKMLKLKKYLMT